MFQKGDTVIFKSNSRKLFDVAHGFPMYIGVVQEEIWEGSACVVNFKGNLDTIWVGCLKKIPKEIFNHILGELVEVLKSEREMILGIKEEPE